MLPWSRQYRSEVMKESEYKIGDIFHLIVSYEETPCIILSIESYRDICTPGTKIMRRLFPGDVSYWAKTQENPWRASKYHKNIICLELLFGDDRAWFMFDKLGHWDEDK